MPLLRGKKLIDDSLYALSMYYASTLKSELLRTNENVWSLALLLGLLALQMRLEAALAARCSAGAGAGAATCWRVAQKAASVVSRTLAFLLLNFVVHVTAQEAASPDVMWMERFVLPILLLLLLSLAVVAGDPGDDKED
jgi:hypothetical protein